MKQKYQISIMENDQIVIREYAELDKDAFSLLCEEMYEVAAAAQAMNGGGEKLMAFLRTQNMYPPGIYAYKIAESVREMLSSGGEATRELVFDDSDLLSRGRAALEVEEEIEDEDADLDDLLGDELDDTYDDKDDVKNVKSSIKISEENSIDLEADA